MRRPRLNFGGVYRGRDYCLVGLVRGLLRGSFGVFPSVLPLLWVLFSVSVTGLAASAQNWRGTNPDQPNGYHASEAGSHYHGNNFLPAQQQNGYHASEARSHYGGAKYEPSSGWNRGDQGRWGGSAYQSANRSTEGFGRWGNNREGRFGSNYNHPYWQNTAFGGQSGTSGQQAQTGFAPGGGLASLIRAREKMSQYGAAPAGQYAQGQAPQMGSFMRSREQQLQNQMRNGTAGFNRIYGGE